MAKSLPLPSKTKPVTKSSIDVKNMSMYANNKSIGKAVIPDVSSIKKPSEKKTRCSDNKFNISFVVLVSNLCHE